MAAGTSVAETGTGVCGGGVGGGSGVLVGSGVETLVGDGFSVSCVGTVGDWMTVLCASFGRGSGVGACA